jgi:hypothetical protein
MNGAAHITARCIWSMSLLVAGTDDSINGGLPAAGPAVLRSILWYQCHS